MVVKPDAAALPNPRFRSGLLTVRTIWSDRLPDYEFQQLHLPRGTSRSDARRILTEHAEYGLWELDRLTVRRDGSRRVVLRRRIIRQLRTI
jgi:hypothetical protein